MICIIFYANLVVVLLVRVIRLSNLRTLLYPTGKHIRIEFFVLMICFDGLFYLVGK